jgi:peptide deformylase
MELRVLQPNDTILRSLCQPVSKKDLQKTSVQKEIETLIDFVYGNNGKGGRKNRRNATTVGLSANQVGIAKCISIVDLAIGKKGYSDIHVLINPEIVWASKSMLERCEGCVNLPTIWGYVYRSKRVKVKALDRSGNELLITLSGWPAILIQHEIDHLQGKLFIEKLDDPKKAFFVEEDDYQDFKRQKKKWKKFIDVTKYRDVV